MLTLAHAGKNIGAVHAAFFAGYVAVSASPDGLVANLLAVFPLTARLVLPARSALTGVPLWQHGAAAALVLTSLYLVVRLAGPIYAHRLLHTGPRVGVRAAWSLSRRT